MGQTSKPGRRRCGTFSTFHDQPTAVLQDWGHVFGYAIAGQQAYSARKQPECGMRGPRLIVTPPPIHRKSTQSHIHQGLLPHACTCRACQIGGLFSLFAQTLCVVRMLG